MNQKDYFQSIMAPKSKEFFSLLSRWKCKACQEETRTKLVVSVIRLWGCHSFCFFTLCCATKLIPLECWYLQPCVADELYCNAERTLCADNTVHFSCDSMSKGWQASSDEKQFYMCNQKSLYMCLSALLFSGLHARLIRVLAWLPYQPSLQLQPNSSTVSDEISSRFVWGVQCSVIFQLLFHLL